MVFSFLSNDYSKSINIIFNNQPTNKVPRPVGSMFSIILFLKHIEYCINQFNKCIDEAGIEFKPGRLSE